jgi:hypothetical protein
MIWGCIMDSTKNLMTILTLLDSQWGKLTSELSNEELLQLKQEFSGLENKMASIDDIDKMNELSDHFIQGFSHMEPLEFLASIAQPQMRGGGLPDIAEEIRIKIINYCVTLQDKIDTLEKER